MRAGGVRGARHASVRARGAGVGVRRERVSNAAVELDWKDILSSSRRGYDVRDVGVVN